MPATLPTGLPLVGRWIGLELMSEGDIDEMYPILSDPKVYADGYVMHRRPSSLQDARLVARERFLAFQGQADGNAFGRTAYAIRLRTDSELRRDMKREDGTFRDSVVFSVLREEWPAVKAGLIGRLG